MTRLGPLLCGFGTGAIIASWCIDPSTFAPMAIDTTQLIAQIAKNFFSSVMDFS